MEAQQRFSLAKHEGPYEHWPVKTALLCDGVPTGTQIEGCVIEAQYRCAHGHLLITSFDCPFEEANSFTLLDDRFQVLAEAKLGVMYGSFLLNAHWPLDGHTLHLHYDMRCFYRLHVDPPGGLLRRRHRLRLTRDDRAWPDDPRAAASVHALENRLAAVRAGLSPIDALPLSELTDGSGGVPRS
jgi:hypothetical protein